MAAEIRSVYTNRNGLYILPADTPITRGLVDKYIRDHMGKATRHEENEQMYRGNHKILRTDKAPHKPNNRLVVNYAKYIVDRLNGYFIGIPVKETHKNEAVNDFLQEFIKENDLQDNEAEISKMCSIFGRAFEILYFDEDSQVRATYLSPVEGFMVYDDTVSEKPLFFVRYYHDADRQIRGEVITRTERRGLDNFNVLQPHYFGDVPVIEYIENEERQGAFESVRTLINAFNKALSEKANDVDYFADAYLKILGTELDEKKLERLRDNRIINLHGQDTENTTVEFMEKPSADLTQENFLTWLRDSIFEISMIANISDDTFGTASSGTALEFKLQSMKDLALNKERKFQASLRRRWRLVFNAPNNSVRFSADEWRDITYGFTRNIPQDMESQTRVLQGLENIVSKETQLKQASFIEDAKAEMELMRKEQAETVGDSARRLEEIIAANREEAAAVGQ